MSDFWKCEPRWYFLCYAGCDCHGSTRRVIVTWKHNFDSFSRSKVFAERIHCSWAACMLHLTYCCLLWLRKYDVILYNRLCDFQDCVVTLVARTLGLPSRSSATRVLVSGNVTTGDHANPGVFLCGANCREDNEPLPGTHSGCVVFDLLFLIIRMFWVFNLFCWDNLITCATCATRQIWHEVPRTRKRWISYAPRLFKEATRNRTVRPLHPVVTNEWGGIYH